jgi:hypothetical protein
MLDMANCVNIRDAEKCRRRLASHLSVKQGLETR